MARKLGPAKRGRKAKWAVMEVIRIVSPNSKHLSIECEPHAMPFEGRAAAFEFALILIDLQNDFLSDRGYLARMGYDPSPLRKIIPNVQALTDNARRAGVHVIFTRQGFRADGSDMTPYDRWRRHRNGLGANDLVRGTHGFEIVDECLPMDSDIIIDKTANSAFIDTELDRVLRSRDVRHLLIAGCTTEVCVHSTIRSAVDLGYQAALVSDACASGDPHMHEAAIAMLKVEAGVLGLVTQTTSVLAGLTD